MSTLQNVTVASASISLIMAVFCLVWWGAIAYDGNFTFPSDTWKVVSHGMLFLIVFALAFASGVCFYIYRNGSSESMTNCSVDEDDDEDN